jgi:hypothetical protein
MESNDDLEDEIRREDGLVRYWMFLNGDTFSLFSALTAGFCAVLWCFLYFIGFGQSVIGIGLMVVAFISFLTWRMLGSELREYHKTGWKKDKHGAQRDAIEIRVAIALWLLIFISIGAIILSQWRHGH